MDNKIISIVVPFHHVTTATATWVFACIADNKEEYNSIYIVTKNEDQREDLRKKIMNMMEFTTFNVKTGMSKYHLIVNDNSYVEIVAGMDYPPLGKTFSKVFLMNLDPETKKKSMQHLAPIVIAKNIHNGIVSIESWD